MNKLKVFRDCESYNNPRTAWDNLGTMAYKHRNYTLGEERISDAIDWLEEKLNISPKGIYDNDRLSELEDKFFDKYIGHKLYLYEHGGITISTSPFSCRWDSGQVGYIYVSKEKVREEYGIKRVTDKWKDKILSYLDNEVKEFDQYITGDVYAFVIVNENDEVTESCGGFFSSDFEKNGMADHIDFSLLGLSNYDKLVEMLKNIEVEEPEYN